jgi:hypothetical protein
MSRAVNREWLFMAKDHRKFLEVFRSRTAFAGIRKGPGETCPRGAINRRGAKDS